MLQKKEQNVLEGTDTFHIITFMELFSYISNDLPWWVNMGI